MIYLPFCLGCDETLYRQEARDPGQVREGGAVAHPAGERRPDTRHRHQEQIHPHFYILSRGFTHEITRIFNDLLMKI